MVRRRIVTDSGRRHVMIVRRCVVRVYADRRLRRGKARAKNARDHIDRDD